MKDGIPLMMVKTMEKCVVPIQDGSTIVTTSFNLWMSKFGFDTFALVINFINSNQVPCHIMGVLFEVVHVGITRATMVCTNEGVLVFIQIVGQSNCICQR